MASSLQLSGPLYECEMTSSLQLSGTLYECEITPSLQLSGTLYGCEMTPSLSNYYAITTMTAYIYVDVNNLTTKGYHGHDVPEYLLHMSCIC
jgi:hypothetical protein